MIVRRLEVVDGNTPYEILLEFDESDWPFASLCISHLRSGEDDKHFLLSYEQLTKLMLGILDVRHTMRVGGGT